MPVTTQVYGPGDLTVDGVVVARAERITVHEGADVRARGFLPIVGTEEIRFTVSLGGSDPQSLDVLRLTLGAIEDAIEEAGNTRKGRALKRQAKKIERALARREGKA